MSRAATNLRWPDGLVDSDGLPPCRICNQPLSGWISSNGVHVECAKQSPDAMYGGRQ